MITIFLARHASPDWNRKDLPYHIPPGPPLTTQGVAEAYSLAEFLHQENVRRLFVSPLERCVHTASIIAQRTGAAKIVIPALIEVQPGETNDDLQARLWPVFERACQSAGEHGPSVLITHGSPIAILLSLLGLELTTQQSYQVYDNNNLLPPGGAWRVNQVSPGFPWDLTLVFPP